MKAHKNYTYVIINIHRSNTAYLVHVHVYANASMEAIV